MNQKHVHRTAGLKLTSQEFEWIVQFLYDKTGITLNEGKQALVMGRLEKRLRARELDSYSDYFALLGKIGNEAETTVAIDLLTTNETYFFREPKHFDFLRAVVFPLFAKQRKIRIWSAASSSGEEAYTLAMNLAEYFPTDNWEVLGTDISTHVLEKARRGLYPLSGVDKIPQDFLRKYCLKGKDEFEDFFLVDSKLRNKVHFNQANLIEKLPDIGLFEVIFLRNVMIYFDMPTKQKLVARIVEKLQPNGYLIISHSETLNGLSINLNLVGPSIYQKRE
jgi:chemotaxis protein methyltransferase CheR